MREMSYDLVCSLDCSAMGAVSCHSAGYVTLMSVSFLRSSVWKKFRLPGKATYPLASAELSKKVKKSFARVEAAAVYREGGQPKAKIKFSSSAGAISAPAPPRD
mmetsp:Transcript_46656/g.61760  ORF Transcript_46656/g.61760 Transcript_46656/m.61760 type:complete len:104 (-) Transcript_46656:259-570(-)